MPERDAFQFEQRMADGLAQCERIMRAAGYRETRADHRNLELPRLAMSMMQSAILPIAAHVISEDNAYDFVCSQALRQEMPLPVALAWPRVSATLLDARSRKIMSRYGLTLPELYGGPEAVAGRLMCGLAVEENLERIDRLQSDLYGQLAELQSLVPKDDRIRVKIDRARGRMLYQVEKAKRRVSEFRGHRQEALARQLARLCGTIAPLGDLQERELAAFQFLLRYSQSVPQTLYEKVDPFLFEHQLISMD